MYTKNTLFVAAALAGSQLAQADPAAPQPANAVQDIKPRQTEDGGDSLLSSLMDLANGLDLTMCLPYALPLVSDLPTVPEELIDPDVISQALAQKSLDNVCDFTVTGDAGKAFTSWLPEVYSFFYKHDADISSIIDDCQNAETLSSSVKAFETCGVPGVTPKPTSTGGGDDDETTTTTTEGGDDSSSSGFAWPTSGGFDWPSFSETPSSSPTESDSSEPTEGGEGGEGGEGDESDAPDQGAAGRPEARGAVAAAAVLAGFVGVVALL